MVPDIVSTYRLGGRQNNRPFTNKNQNLHLSAFTRTNNRNNNHASRLGMYMQRMLLDLFTFQVYICFW